MARVGQEVWWEVLYGRTVDQWRGASITTGPFLPDQTSHTHYTHAESIRLSSRILLLVDLHVSYSFCFLIIDERAWETGDLLRAENGIRVEGQDPSGTSDHQSNQSSDPKPRKVAQADPRKWSETIPCDLAQKNWCFWIELENSIQFIEFIDKSQQK